MAENSISEDLLEVTSENKAESVHADASVTDANTGNTATEDTKDEKQSAPSPKRASAPIARTRRNPLVRALRKANSAHP